MQNFRALGAPPSDPCASGGWGLCPQTPSLRRLEASPPDPCWLPAAGGSAPRPPKQPSHCEFLATRLQDINDKTHRGGVEDIRLGAKAKDTKKIRGQGQPFRGQTLSMPRTGMLEAKDKDTAASVLQKKKRSSKIFFRQSPIYRRVARTFDWGGLNHKSHAMTSSKIRLFALNQDFAKGEGLN